jgi:hypothetical protein
VLKRKPPNAPGLLPRTAAERARLAAAYEQFMSTEDLTRKSEVGQELIRAIFGKAAIAEDPLR